ncbi:2,3-dihydroxybenzoate-AMP ligase [Thermopolyspora flexuosa]|mgnify:FL=1|jgi:2,3-dihydroxybenzoate-AMP ligase|uniref:2,3-dihydroxybenzoate-AMP ligase n=1 Tax=Thermopolyspora flexuosa TaxID=103836 RepID=A0A543IVY1_9ACTN|nr:(2,3-dihydroxybenzoyl)adenylate synthase [Thermopolyspora flexuosa]TQM74743.1 2,3-dihydroxybenzoate-AMP ligase [Thermopolyspora flexuosa]GGM78487.1 2,3-dihydroxybenzoate-AMP ligase [Thermopolyspora flexuosa]
MPPTPDGVVPYPPEFAERYRAKGYWRGQTFGGLLRELAGRYGERTAIVDGDRRWTYRDLDRKADRLAAGLYGLGIRPGDRVVLQLPNIAEFYQVCFALYRIGAWPVFALPAHRSAEIGYFCSFTEAVAYIHPGVHAGYDHAEIARGLDVRHVLTPDTLPETDPIELPGPKPGDVAFLQLSGGSTGLPKLIPRTHDDYIYSFEASARICELTPESVYLCALPAAHNFPMSSPGVFGVLSAGATAVMAPDPSPDTCFPLIERERVTITALVPPLALVWMDAAPKTRHDLSSLRVLQVGGAKFTEEAARRVRPTLGCTLQQVFGMAEGLVNYTRYDDPEEIIVTSQGRPISEDDEIRIVDDEDREVPEGTVGHLLTRGPYTIRGYYKAPEHNKNAFTEDGFYRTGDLVRRLPSGHLVVEGRAKDQINRGGDKIAGEEVENHLLAHPNVHDAVVVGVPDPYLGERACAYVIPKGEPPTRAELRRFLRDRGIAAFKIPDRFEFVDAFPTTAVGKVSRRRLRELS